MGDSAKLPDSGPGSYRFVEQRRHLDALLEALAVPGEGRRPTLTFPRDSRGQQKSFPQDFSFAHNRWKSS